MSSRRSPGFSMIEMLVVIAIMAILATLGMVSYQGASRNARNGKRAADIESVRAAIVLYRADNGTYPSHGASADPVERFNFMLSTLNTDGYYSASTLEDPGSYTYRYWAGGTGTTYSVCYNTEPDGTQVCLQDL